MQLLLTLSSLFVHRYFTILIFSHHFTITLLSFCRDRVIFPDRCKDRGRVMDRGMGRGRGRVCTNSLELRVSLLNLPTELTDELKQRAT